MPPPHAVTPRAWPARPATLLVAVGLLLGTSGIAAAATSGAGKPTFSGAPGAMIAAPHIGPHAGNGAPSALVVGPGRESALTLGIAYDAVEQHDGPITVNVTLPGGLEMVRTRTILPDSLDRGAAWTCAPGAPTITCTLLRADGQGAYALSPDTSAGLVMVVRGTDQVPAVADGAPPLSLADVNATVNVPFGGVVPALTSSTTVPVQAASGPFAPRIVVGKVLRPSAESGNPATRDGYDLLVQNVGAGPARTGSGQPAVSLSKVLPPLRVKGITISGAGWSCNRSDRGTCRLRQRIDVGGAASIIKVRWPAIHDTSKIQTAWTIRGIAGFDGALTGADIPPGALPAPGTVPFTANLQLNFVNTVVNLDVHTTAPHGIEVLSGGKPTPLKARITNTGDAFARVFGVRVTVPKGMLVSIPTPGWKCPGGSGVVICRATTHLKPKASASFDLLISAPPGQPAAPGRLQIVPIGRQDAARGATRNVALAVLDPGDPRATPHVFLLDGGKWERWVDGGTHRVPARDDFTYRIALFNSGGDVLQPGTPVQVTQAIGSSMALKAVNPGPGITCAQGRQVSCTLTTTQPIQPEQSFGDVLVTVTPSAPDPTANLGPVVATVSGQRESERLPMDVEVTDNPNSLRPSMKVTHEPTAGGVGRVSMVLRNDGRGPVTGLSAIGTLPAGLAVTGVTAPAGWSCAISGRAGVKCAYRYGLKGGARTPGVVLKVAAARGQKASRNDMTWRAAGRASDGARQAGLRRGPVPIRGPITVGANVTPSVVSAVKEMTAEHRRVSLDGSSSTGNGISLDYRWTQRCTTAADAAKVPSCRGRVAPVAAIDSPFLPSTHAVLPLVRTRTRFTFELTITDGSARASRTVTVTQAVPVKAPKATKRSTGLSPADAAARAAITRNQRSAAAARRGAVRGATAGRRGAASTSARNARAARATTPRVRIADGPIITAQPGTSVNLAARLQGRWTGEVTYQWTQVSGRTGALSGTSGGQVRARAPDTPGRIVVRVRARDAAGHVASGQVIVNAGKAASPQAAAVMAGAARAASSGKPLNVSLPGGNTATLKRLRAMQGATAVSDQAGAAYSFSASELKVGQMSISRASGNVSTTGIQLDTGTLTFPAAWKIGPLSVVKGKPLVYTFASGGDPSSLVGQVADATHFAFLSLPTGWAGTTTVTFAKDSWSIEATAVGDSGGKVIVDGTAKQDGTYSASVTASKIATFEGATLDMSGTITKAAADKDATTTVTGSLGEPVTLADGVRLESLTAKWTPNVKEGPVLSGSASISIDSGASTPLTIDAQLKYTGANDWSVELSGSGGPSWNPLPGLSLSASNLTGSVGMEKGEEKWNVTGKVATWQVSSILTLSDVQIDLTNDCGDGTQPACPKGELFLKLGTSARLAPPVIQPITMKTQAILGLGDGGGFALYATMPNLTLGPGVELGSPSLNVTYNMPDELLPSSVGMPSFSLPQGVNSGFNIQAIGSLKVPGLGDFGSIVSMITPKGWTLGGFDLDGVSLGSGNGSQSGAWFGWSSFDTTMSVNMPGIGLKSIPVPKDSFAVTGDYSAPGWFTKMVGLESARAVGTINFDAGTGFFSAKIAFDGTYTLPGGGSSLQSTSVFFDLQNNATGITVAVGGTTTLGVQGMDANGQEVAAPQLDMRLGFDLATQTVSASLTFTDPAGWKDAFGVDGLVINRASFTLEVNVVTLTPGLKLMAEGQLPPSVAGPLQVPGQGIPIRVGAELSAAHPCVAFAVGNPKGTQPVLQVGGGVASANFFEFILAPSGCQLSPLSPAIPPGFSIAFDGQVLGATVDVGATLQIAPAMKLDAHVNIGAFELGGVQFEKTTLQVKLDEAAGTNEVSFSGGFTIFGNGVNVAGSLKQDGTTTSASLDVQQVGQISVDGFTLEDMRFRAAVQVGPSVNKVAISASGKVNVLGQMLDVRQFAVSIDNGVVEDVSFDVQAKININDVATADGEFQMSYTESSGDFRLHASVALSTAAGFNIGTAEKPATLDISPQCAAFEGSIQMGRVFTATLSGTFAYADGCTQTVRTVDGQRVAATKGDFSIAADNVALQLGAFETTGSVAIGDVGGTAYAAVKASLTLGTQDAGGDVNVAGSFQSNGDFSFDGSGNLSLAGFSLNTAVRVANKGGDVEVSGSAKLDLAGTTVEISGQFTEVNGAPSTTLRGAINSLSLGGFSLGRAEITLTQTPTKVGVEAAVDMTVGDAATGQLRADGTISFVEGTATDGVPLFYASLNGNMGFPSIGATMTGNVTFSNCDANCARPAPVRLSLNGAIGAGGFKFVTEVNMSSDGTFAAAAVFNSSQCTGTVDLLVIRAQGCFDFTVNLWVGSSAPYGTLSATASASVNIQEWDASPWYAPWEWTWGSWRSYGVSLGASIQLSPFRICMNVMGMDLCV